MYLSLDGMNAPMGNFTFIYQKTHNSALFNAFLDAESHLKLNYVDLAHKLRMAFELFALEEYISDKSKNNPSVASQIREEIVNEIKAPASTTNYKTIIIDLCKGREQEFADVLLKHHFLKYSSGDADVVKRMLAKLIRTIYAFGSDSSHEGSDKEVTYIDCLNSLSVFHDFLIVYYHATAKSYDHKLAPIGEYITISKTCTEKMGLDLDLGKTLHVRVRHGQLKYYVLSQETSQISKPQRRDIEVIEKLWEENFDDPANVIRQSDVIQGADPNASYRVYSLPGKPLRLNSDLVGRLSIDEKTISFVDYVKVFLQYIVLFPHYIIGIFVQMHSIYLRSKANTRLCCPSLSTQKIRPQMQLSPFSKILKTVYETQKTMHFLHRKS